MLITIYEWLGVIALLTARILPSFLFLPFLNSNVINNSIRYPVAFIISYALFPSIDLHEKVNIMSWLYLILLFKEVGIGIFLSCIFSMPFWTLYIMGNIIDQQRGATLSSTYDPISGIDSSELATFFNLFAAIVFLLVDGVMYFVQILKVSYDVFSPFSLALPDLAPFLTLLGLVIAKGLIMSSPVLASFFMLEIVLGLLSRYSPQMNAFALAMSVKSLIAFFILLVYFTLVTPSVVYDFSWANVLSLHYFNW